MRGHPANLLWIAIGWASLNPVSGAPGPDADGSRGSLAIPLTDHGSAKPGFRLLPAQDTGLDFTNLLSDSESAANRVLENGSGVAVGDFDSDQWPDLFLCGLSGNSALFRNLGGWRFTNVTESVGLRRPGECDRGAVFADLNGDRQPDLLISTLSRGVRCFLNEHGRFRDATDQAGLGARPGSTTLALADVDGNGTLDLYVTRYRDTDIRDVSQVEVRRVGGQTELHPKYAGRLSLGPNGLIEFGESDSLYLNDGQARFQEVSWTDGHFLDETGKPLAAPPQDWGLTASFRDLNGDGLPDLYVCNDYWSPDRLWMNAGNGTFRAADRDALRHTSENSMGVDFADVNRDGHVDFLVLDMLSRDARMRRRQALAQTTASSMTVGSLPDRPQYMRNAFFVSRGDGTFAELSEYAGLPASDWSWQPLFVDVDLDGFEDVLISAGHRRDVQDLDATDQIRGLQHPWSAATDPATRQQLFTREMMEHARLYPPLELPVVAFRNRGDLKFDEVTTAWGFDAAAVHQGIATADFDQDGDLDLVVNRLDASAALYRNEGGGARIAVRLRGLPPNTEGIGARIRLVGTGGSGRQGPIQSREMITGGRYLSGSQPLVAFALPSDFREPSLEVEWRRGGITRVTPVEPGRLYEIDEAEAQPSAVVPPSPQEPIFEDASSRLGHSHVENPFDDLARQPLLPTLLSRAGPGVCWFDLNGDGWEDLVVTTGAGGLTGVFTNDTRGGFDAAPTAFGDAAVPRDQVAVVAFQDRRGRARVLVGSSSYEDPTRTLPGVLDRAAFSSGGGAALPDGGFVAGPLALGDVDGDGDLDIFQGTGAKGGRYPEPASSLLFLQEEQGWRPDTVNLPILRDLGQVNGAVWGDLDLDGDVDLVLACEWSPLRVFRNDAGRLTEATREWGLEPWSGLWNGVTLGDLDGDGRLDIVAANWGLNSSRTASAQRPTVLYYGDFLGRGVVDLLETEWDIPRGVLSPRQRLDILQAAWPTLRSRFPTHRAFSEATAEEVVKSFGVPALRLEARTLASMAFLNRGGRFEARELPAEAQFTAARSVTVADFDGDGHEDVFLSQNCFALPSSTPRLDAGEALLLKGIGGGALQAVSSDASGIRVPGDQRGAASADFDHDGRLDLVVTQNGGATRLFRNRQGAPGIRVRLVGLPGNPNGVGAQLRLRTPGGWGPAHPILGGSGYASQDSATAVLGGLVSGGAIEIEVRWPRGSITRAPVPAGAREMVVRQEASQ
ncbi:MAG: VCBS repeat-containing protein [Verrucomicrobiales bacterium]|nr:VCBS repeat-containing protein [Verrucomicrobiales bacterium]